MEERENIARKDTPSAVMYRKLKSFGISNRQAANILMNAILTFDGRMLRDRIDESSQLSRRIVHTLPGELPIGLFNSFPITCPQIYRHAIEKIAIARCGGDHGQARVVLDDDLKDECHELMLQALRKCEIDDAMYRNMASYIEHANLPSEDNRTLLRLMMFVITGCLGNPRTASVLVVDYATNILGADFNTAQSVISTSLTPANDQPDILLGLVRIIDGHIKANARMHMLNPEGTELGLLPSAKHVVADVDAEVSRSHAFIWRDHGIWYIRDLASTNGTRVVSGSDGSEAVVGTSLTDPTPIAATDIICLGATTRFMVVPVLGV